MDQKLIELAGRCEKAEGPDQELDEAIACAVAEAHPKYGKPVGMLHCKAFTASLDAALTLVPERLKWSCGFSNHVPHNAQVWSAIGSGYYEGECDSNRALALCAAALRARAAID